MAAQARPSLDSSIDRVVFRVRDFQVSLAFQRDTLGLPLVSPALDNWVEFRAGELFLWLHGPWPGLPYDLAEFARSPDEALFRVDDIQGTRAALISRGVDVADPHSPGPRVIVAEFADPDGRRVGIEGNRGTTLHASTRSGSCAWCVNMVA